MADYLVTSVRKIRVDDDVTEMKLRKELMETLRDVQNADCRTVNGLRYRPVGRIGLVLKPVR